MHGTTKCQEYPLISRCLLNSKPINLTKFPKNILHCTNFFAVPTFYCHFQSSPTHLPAAQAAKQSMASTENEEPSLLKNEVWQDQSFFKWRKRDAHVPLRCHDTIEGSLRYWFERSKVDISASNLATWDDNAVAAALKCASSWVEGLPFVTSLSGCWKFHLASGPSGVPKFFTTVTFMTMIGELYQVLSINFFQRPPKNVDFFKYSFGDWKLDKASAEDGLNNWDTKKGDSKSQSSWGQPSDSTLKKSALSADQWGSDKSKQFGSSSGWGSEETNFGKDSEKQDSWGKPKPHGSDDSQSSWGQPGGSGWNKKRPEGGRGWGCSNTGEWKSRKNQNHNPNQNRPPRGPNDDSASVAPTATRKRMDSFPAEEQDVLSEVELVMQSIRRIMHQSGCNDGEPLPPDDQKYIIDNVLNYHPDKAAKIGAGVDFITVKKHSNFQESRCFYVVSTDGQNVDFSYIKCLETYVKGKYPSVAVSFTSKYFRRPRP